VRLTCRPHVSLLGSADSKSGHCEQTDRHRRKLCYSRAGNYRIIKHSWVNSCVDIKRRCQVSDCLPNLTKKGAAVSCRAFTVKFRVRSQASHLWQTKRQYNKFSSDYFGFHLSLSFYRCFILNHLRLTLYNPNQFTVSFNYIQGKIAITCLFLSQK